MSGVRDNLINGQRPEFGNREHIEFVRTWDAKQKEEEAKRVEKERQAAEQKAVTLTTVGSIIDNDDMHWCVECPNCGHGIEYTGYFDSSDIYDCKKCKAKFRVTQIEFEDGSYIK